MTWLVSCFRAMAQEPPAAHENAANANTQIDGETTTLPQPSLIPPAAVPITMGSVEVEVEAKRDQAARRLARSSAAVVVVDIAQAQRETGDMGAVLARQQGVNVQRAGGLGSQTRISLLGLGDDQIRFYVDGIPLAFTGLPESIAYVPLDLIARAELYRGVVPTRFGGDTLGGAIHLVSLAPVPGSHGSASLTWGAFDTQRAALRAQHYHKESGLYASLFGNLDHARNDYPMDDIGVVGSNGKKRPARVYRLNDRYEGGFGQLEVGVLDRSYADRLTMRGFLSGFDKELNHDVLMETPYGEVLERRRSQGATLFYEKAWSKRLSLDAKAGYARRTRQLRDTGDCAYDWSHQCIAEIPGGGEIFGVDTNRKTEEHNLFARAQLLFNGARWLQLRGSVAPTYTQSEAKDIAALSTIPDTFAQDRKLFGVVLGLEHELDALRGRLENVLFLKDYVQHLSADVTLTAGPKHERETHHRVGVGNALRVRLHDTLITKASYELGARMPAANEVFGDGVQIDSNLALSPERSHNMNLELHFEQQGVWGQAALGATGFYRQIEDFIFLLPGPRLAQYHNVADARAKGVEGTARYVTPGDYLTIDGNLTWQDLRSLEKSGPFAQFEGERIPNRPFLFGNLSVTGALRNVVVEQDALSLTFRESYVAAFDRAFNVKDAQERDEIKTQLLSSLLFAYEMVQRGRTISMAIEANNLTDAKAYDFFQVRKPGRHALAKLMFRM